MSDQQPIKQNVEAKGGSTIKNVIQFMVHLVVSPWGLAILAIGLVVGLVASATILVQPQFHPPTSTPIPTATPTPLAFAPAREGESLIVVADFEDRSGGKYQGIDPAQYIYEQLVAQVNKDKLDVRPERLHHIVDDNTVRKAGEVYGATLVLWGWYDALTITPRMERIKTWARYRSSEEGRHLSLADPEKVKFTIITDLPSQATYLALFTLGLESYASENADQAKAYLDSALASIPQEVAASTNPSETYFFRGTIYFIKNDYDRAIADYDKAIQLKPDYADAYVSRGSAYGRKGDYERAIADFDQAIQLEPDDAIVYSNRGNAYSDKGDYERAIADLDRAIQLKPGDVDAYGNRGNAYVAKGDYERAIADYDKVIQLKPDDAKAYYNRGIVYSDRGDYERAIADYDKTIQLEPDDAKAYGNRGIAYYNKGDYERAIADYDKTIQLEPDDAKSYYNRGIAYYAKGDSERAIANWDKAIRLKPDYADAYYNRGVAYKQKGNIDKAIADFKKSLELDSDSNSRQQAELQLKELGARY